MNPSPEFIDRLRSGSEEAWAELVAGTLPLLWSFFHAKGAPVGRIEDLTQETYTAAWESIDHLEKPESLRPWLTGIATNIWRMHCAGLQTALPTPPEPAPRESVQIDVAELRKLKRSYFDLLFLRYARGLEPCEIAELLGRKPVTVRSGLKRARDKLLAAARERERERENGSPGQSKPA